MHNIGWRVELAHPPNTFRQLVGLIEKRASQKSYSNVAMATSRAVSCGTIATVAVNLSSAACK